MSKCYSEFLMVKYGCFYLYGTPRGSPGDSQKNDGPVPDPYRNKVVPYRSRTVRDSYGIPRDPLQTPLMNTKNFYFQKTIQVSYNVYSKVDLVNVFFYYGL